MSLISELRRRNVFRVATAYALVAWIIIEAGSVLLPTFGAPGWAFRIYVIAVFCGFLISVILAWVFELTPEGVKLDRDLDRDSGSSPPPQRKNAIIIALLVIALTVSISLNVTGLRDASAPLAVPKERPSIAVLPFENRSTDPDNAMFADGIHDDLLTRLAGNRSLRVISRTSVLAYRGTNLDLRQIGRDLAVDTILTGSVQRVGADVRINMQLFDARTDDNLWAKTYNRRLTMEDLFDIQGDIASAISYELRVALSSEDEDRMSRLPTSNLIAYNRYNEGRSDMAMRRMPEARTAREKFQQAVAIDPDFAEAYAALATSTLLLYINNRAIPRAQAFEEADRAINRALELNPDLADAYAARGLLNGQLWQESRVGDENIVAAEAFMRALELNPNHASAYMWFASLRTVEGDIDQAISLYEKSMEVDPLGRIPYANLPPLYASKGLHEEALAQLIQSTEIFPDWPTPLEFIVVHLGRLGRLDEALAWYRHARSLSDDPYEMTSNIDVWLYMEFGETERAKQAIAILPEMHPLHAYQKVLGYLVDLDVSNAYQTILKILESAGDPPIGIYALVANLAIANDDLDTARKYVLLDNPVLAGDSELVVDKHTMRSVVQLAYIEMHQGHHDKAMEMLNRALPVVQDQVRMGISGHGILDVQIYALLGRKKDALLAFAAAVEEGYRSAILFDFWPLDKDPYIASIRDSDEFVALVAVIDQDMERMHRNALAAEETGDWDSLRQIAIQAAHTGMRAALAHATR